MGAQAQHTALALDTEEAPRGQDSPSMKTAPDKRALTVSLDVTNDPQAHLPEVVALSENGQIMIIIRMEDLEAVAVAVVSKPFPQF